MADPSISRNSLSESTLRTGERLGAYVVEGLLGVGGMAEVYAARHSALDKRFALKILKWDPAQSDELRQRFLREGQSASRIEHPHIVAINDVVDDGTRVYIVMELLEGETLGAVMERDLILPVQRVLEYLVPVIAAMGAAHLRGVVHRDLKPDNIFLARDPSGRAFPKVLDFGVSKLADHVAPRVTATDTVLGTPHYMAPEQALGRRNVDGKADQFALGIIFYEAIVGRLPYTGTSPIELIHEVARGEVPKPSIFKSWVPKDLEDALMRALLANPEDRYPTMEAFGLALLPFANDRTIAQWEGALSGLVSRSSFPPSGEGRSPSGRSAPTTALRPARMRHDAPTQSGQRPVERSIQAPVDPIPAAESLVTSPPKSRAPIIGLTLAIVLALGSIAAFFVWRSRPVVRAIAMVPSAHVSVDGQEIGSGSLVTITLPSDGSSHHITVHAEGHAPFEATLTDLEHLPATVTLTPLLAEAPEAAEAEATDEVEALEAPTVEVEQGTSMGTNMMPRRPPRPASESAPAVEVRRPQRTDDDLRFER